MDNSINQSDKDKLRVITAEEVLEELRRRKKEYGSVFLPTNSYQVIKNGKVDNQNNTKNNSGDKSSPKKNANLRKAVLFLESFAFKKPLQSVFTVLMLLGITTGMYIATRPVGELDNRNQAAIPEAPYLGVLDSTGNRYPISTTNPTIYCTLASINTTCLIKNISSFGVNKVVVVSKPDFLNLSFDSSSGKVNVTTNRALTPGDQEKALPIKLLGIPNDQSTYKLLYFTLKITNSAQPTALSPLVVRNPIGYVNSTGCEGTDEAGSKGKWKTFASATNCNTALHAPVIVTPDTVTLNYETQCIGNPTQKTVSFDATALDSDGDLTRFEVDSKFANTNNARVEESLVNYIQRVVGEVDSQSTLKSYSDYKYKNAIKLDIQPQDIGKTIPVKVLAINQNNSSYNTSKVINVKINEKVVSTNINLAASVISPKVGETIKGATTINWSVSNSCDFTRYKVEVWDKYCTTYKTKLTDETFANVSKTGTSFKTNFDTRNVADGEYCVRVFVRNSVNEAWRVGSTNTISVQNNLNANKSPSIISNPTNTNIKSGVTFSYVIKTTDQDNDAVTISLDKKPDWLKLSGSTLSGSTLSAGKYDISLRAKDSKGAYSPAQIFSITVSPSDNTPSVITFDPFPVSNTVSGSYIFKWNATDTNGIKSETINISSDGVTWEKLADLKSSDKSYSIDTSKYKNGEYYLKLTVTDNKDDVVEKITDKFVIENGEAKVVVTITNHTPITNEKVTSLRPDITLKLVIPEGSSLDEKKLNVTIDEKVITTLCNYSNLQITCKLDKDLTQGSHKVNVEYYDNFGVKGVETWEFEVIAESSSSISSQGQIQEVTDSNSITIFGRTISKALGILLLVLCIAGILIFVIPLIIFRVWKRKDKEPGDNLPKPPTPGPIKSTITTKTVSTNELPKEQVNVEPVVERIVPKFSYNTKREFDVQKPLTPEPTLPVEEVTNVPVVNPIDNFVSEENNVPEIKKTNVVTNIPIANTPTSTENNVAPISSFQNVNNYANLPKSNTEVKTDDLSKPSIDASTSWGLAEKYKSNDDTRTQDATKGDS